MVSIAIRWLSRVSRRRLPWASVAPTGFARTSWGPARLLALVIGTSNNDLKGFLSQDVSNLGQNLVGSPSFLDELHALSPGVRDLGLGGDRLRYRRQPDLCESEDEQGRNGPSSRA